MKINEFIIFVLLAAASLTYLEIRLARLNSITPKQFRLGGQTKVTLFPFKNNITSTSGMTNIKQGVTAKMPYLLENPVLCTSVANLSVLVMVHTAPSHHRYRQTMRETWMNYTYYSNLGSVRVLFLLGAVKNMSLQAEIVKEFNKHNDILQGDFIDAYHNLTYKGVMAYKWLTEKCRNAKIILKVDDDVLINMFKLLSEFMPPILKKTKFMSCRHYHRNKIDRVRSSKWYIDEHVFPNQTVYPDYCQGCAVIISNDLVPALYKFASETPFFWIDDVYLYGLLPGKVSGVHYRHLGLGKEVSFDPKIATKCYKDKNEKCTFLVMMFRSDVIRSMREIWGLIVQYYKNTPIHVETANVSNHVPLSRVKS